MDVMDLVKSMKRMYLTRPHFKINLIVCDHAKKTIRNINLVRLYFCASKS